MSTGPAAATTAREVVERYGAAWHEHDEAARKELLGRCWAPDGVYCDPGALVHGREALVEHIAGFQLRMPGHRLDLTTAVDEHHGWLCFGWRMLGPDDEVVLEGMDVGELDASGRLRRIVGFFGPL